MTHDAGRDCCAEYTAMKWRIEELENLFDMQWEADMRGIKMWQEATGKTMTWPDRAEHVAWLLGEIDKLKATMEGVECALARDGDVDAAMKLIVKSRVNDQKSP